MYHQEKVLLWPFWQFPYLMLWGRPFLCSWKLLVMYFKLWTFHTSLATPKDLHLLQVRVSGIVFPLRGKSVRNPKLFLCVRLGMSFCYSWWVSCIRCARRKTIWIFSGARNSFNTGAISKKNKTLQPFFHVSYKTQLYSTSVSPPRGGSAWRLQTTNRFRLIVWPGYVAFFARFHRKDVP